MDIVRVVPDEDVLRRLAPDTVDLDRTCVRRNAFYTHGAPDPEISVHIQRLAGSVDALLIAASRPHFGMGSLKVSEILELGFEVESRPLPDDPSHAVILGVTSRAHCDQLAEITTIVKWPVPRSAS
jgi:hypothetical protein